MTNKTKEKLKDTYFWCLSQGGYVAWALFLAFLYKLHTENPQ